MAARVSEQVHQRLRDEILAGRLDPGDAVASERALAEEMGVGRHAVREALKRLQQAGLVEISQGGATRVLDWRRSGGLELLIDVFERSSLGPEAQPDLVRAVLETRATIGIDAARRCAERASESQRSDVRSEAERAGAAIGSDEQTLDAAYEELWRLIVDGAQNLAYRLALNSLVGGIQRYERIAVALRPTDRELLERLGDAIAIGDGERAAKAAAALLGPDAELQL